MRNQDPAALLSKIIGFRDDYRAALDRRENGVSAGITFHDGVFSLLHDMTADDVSAGGSASTVTLNLRATWQDAGSQAFAARLVELGYTLPVAEQPGNVGEIIDASGKNILQVDPMGIRDDDEVSAIAALVTLAINMAGGLPPVAEPILSKPAEVPADG